MQSTSLQSTVLLSVVCCVEQFKRFAFDFNADTNDVPLGALTIDSLSVRHIIIKHNLLNKIYSVNQRIAWNSTAMSIEWVKESYIEGYETNLDINENKND